jgi:hypothetical protein
MRNEHIKKFYHKQTHFLEPWESAYPDELGHGGEIEIATSSENRCLDDSFETFTTQKKGRGPMEIFAAMSLSIAALLGLNQVYPMVSAAPQ